MLAFDPTTNSGHAFAVLFRRWCELRGDDPEGEVDGADMLEALAQQFDALGLDIGGPASQLDVPADHRVFTVFGLTFDRAGGGGLLVSAVVPGEHAEKVAVLANDEQGYGRWAQTFTAPSADAAAGFAREPVEGGKANHEVAS